MSGLTELLSVAIVRLHRVGLSVTNVPHSVFATSDGDS